MPDAGLLHAVVTCDLAPLRRLYAEARATGRVPMHPSHDDKMRFLTVCHHCATAAGINNRMAVLSARLRRDPIDLANVRQASDEWAAAVLAKRTAATNA
jgi:hypothetical protein